MLDKILQKRLYERKVYYTQFALDDRNLTVDSLMCYRCTFTNRGYLCVFITLTSFLYEVY